jgi:hypothetical protein
MFDTNKHRHGETNINPLIQALGSGLFTLIDKPDDIITALVWQPELDRLSHLAKGLLTEGEGLPTELSKNYDLLPVKQRVIRIEEAALWGLRSIVGTLKSRQKKAARRRYAVSALLEKIGRGAYTILAVPDIHIRHLYLNTHPLVLEYLEVNGVIEAERRKHKENHRHHQ